MKIKKGLVLTTTDFWYDLISGGYLKPGHILENQEDIEKVLEAIKILEEFEKSCGEQIEDFIQ